jgi:hypothetical protein
MNFIISMLRCYNVFILILLLHSKHELNSIKCIVSYVHQIYLLIIYYTSNFLLTNISNDVSIINYVAFHFLQQFVSALFFLSNVNIDIFAFMIYQTSHTFILLQIGAHYQYTKSCKAFFGTRIFYSSEGYNVKNSILQLYMSY